MIRTLLQPLALLALTALCAGTALGQASKLPVSRTGGATSVSLPVGQTTLMALPLVEIVASGTVSAVSGSTYTLLSTPTVLPDVVTTPHAIKITGRANQFGTNAYGMTARITAQASQDVTTPVAPAAGSLMAAPNVGDEYVVYRIETIGSLFGVTNTVGLRGGSTVATADIIYLDNGSGTLVAYFYRTGGTPGWRLVSAPSGANQDGVIIQPNRGILVARKTGGTPVTINISGDAMVGNEVVDVTNSAANIVNNPFLVSTTLLGSGLRNYVTGGSTAATADIVYLESGGVLTGYFYRTSVSQWRLLSTPGGADQGAVAITPGKAILIAKKATGEFTLVEPFAP